MPFFSLDKKRSAANAGETKFMIANSQFPLDFSRAQKIGGPKRKMQRQLLQLYTTTISRLKLHFTSCTRDFSGGKHAPSYFRPGHHSSKSSSLTRNRKFAIILGAHRCQKSIRRNGLSDDASLARVVNPTHNS